MSKEAYESYLARLRVPDLKKREVKKVFTEAAEDPFISCAEYEALWFVWRNIMGGGDF